MTKQERQQQKSLEGLYEIESSLIAKVIQLQANPESSASDIEKALKSLKYVEDLIVVREWTAALRETIESNPSLALPPGGQGSTARLMQGMVQQIKRREHRDQRRGDAKNKDGQQPTFGKSIVMGR